MTAEPMTLEPAGAIGATPLDAAMAAFFKASALMDPLRLRIWDLEGLTVTQLRLLMYVAEREGLSNAELADRLYVTRPSVSALLERLERGGFLRPRDFAQRPPRHLHLARRSRARGVQQPLARGQGVRRGHPRVPG